MRWEDCRFYAILAVICCIGGFVAERIARKPATPNALMSNSDGVGAQPLKVVEQVFTTGVGGKDEGGVSRSFHYSIEWGPTKTQPLEVLESTLARMEHVQKTMNASDTNAKALFHVMQAVDILNGQEVKEIPQSTGSAEK